MAKFTRDLTREVEVGGERLSVTLSAEGLSLRPVGGRKPPFALSWAGVLAAGVAGAEPRAADVADALKKLRQGGPEEAGGLGDTLAKIDRWLLKNRKRFHQALRKPATPAELDALQKELAQPLPDELRTLLSWHNGQGPDEPGAFEGSYRLLGTGEVAAEKKTLDGGSDGWQKTYIPFLEDDRGDCLFVDAAKPGGPVCEHWAGKKEKPEAAASLTAWFAQFLKDLEAGAYTEDPERGEFLRAEG
jgi:cell wall assembly regulator SMI1